MHATLTYSPPPPAESCRVSASTSAQIRDARHVNIHLCWDEQNRLQGVMDDNSLSVYQYDANGDRTYKLTGKHTHQNISGTWHHFYQLDNATLYASPYLVVTPKGYTKHYYAESERVASKLGNGGLLELDYPLVDESLFRVKRYANTEHAQNVVDKCLHAEDARPSAPLSYLYELMEVSQEPENERYWYHPDHLGSSSWITFSDGEAVQHLHYLPFGEDLVNQQLTVTGALFTFSAKEKDSETGFSYFGSRYYNSDLSIWLSVDPMASKYPYQSNYVYCSNNPLKIIDPNGEDEWELYPDGKVRWKRHSEEHTLYAVNTKGERTGNSLTLKNRQIFDDLATSGESSNYLNSHSVGGENTQDDMLNVFKFAADNSTVEWRVDRFRDNGNSSYAVGTVHKTNYSPTAEDLGHSSSSVIAFIHSHPNANLSGELWSMGFRSQVNGKIRYGVGSDYDLRSNHSDYNCLYYTCFPKSGNLYSVRSHKKPAYIRNVTKYRQFMFGTINTR